MNSKAGGLAAMPSIAALCLVLACPQAVADTGMTHEDYWKPYKPPVPIWIRDPWTGRTTLAYYEEPSTDLWNGKRITDYEESLEADMAPPLGVLRIDKLDINVPVWNGTDELVLNRGAGRIKGMARTDEDGNLGISGHRDGYFRVLKDIQLGDRIEMETATGVQHYEVASIDIVPKSDVSVLVKSEEKMMTLVTCYPFYYVGNAPKRLIVKADATEFIPAADSE